MAVSVSTLAVGNETGFSVVVRDISELASVRSERDRLLISADRERIARDLHDLVIQRLFGAGLRLQGALGLIDNEPAVARVSSTIDDLDATIKEIREAIFALESAPGTGLRARVLEAVADATEALGFKPTVSFHGLGRPRGGAARPARSCSGAKRSSLQYRPPCSRKPGRSARNG